MANREELGIIKGARAGERNCQLALGKLYLFGSAGLPNSAPTALYWLQRAAQQGCAEACLLIGRHIPYALARQGGAAMPSYYRQAYEAGALAAGLVLAQLVLHDGAPADAALHASAQRGLEAAAEAGFPDALWLLARQNTTGLPDAQDAGSGAFSMALQAALEQAWQDGDWKNYLGRALPMARLLLFGNENPEAFKENAPGLIGAANLLLLSRCGQALLLDPAGQGEGGSAEAYRFFELAAVGGDRAAQLALGLWLARMDARGARLQANRGAVNFKRAIRWLTQAGEQGLAEAWFALSRIYIKPEFSQRSMMEALSCLERAAGLGHSAAQLECGIHAWRNRRDGDNSDVRAAYWLLKAAAQGSAEAEAALEKIAPRARPADWGQALEPLAALELAASQPLLAARLELGRRFHLSRAEALLLDVHAADQGHCLVLDIRASYGRGKRRLVLLRTAQERQALDRIARLFEQVDCSLAGPEGNYRQRLYRLKTCLRSSEEAAPDGQLLLA